MKIEQISETSAYKIQTPWNYPEENIQQKIVLSEVWLGAFFESRSKLTSLALCGVRL
jgi:hypothetical protein